MDILLSSLMRVFCVKCPPPPTSILIYSVSKELNSGNTYLNISSPYHCSFKMKHNQAAQVVRSWQRGISLNPCLTHTHRFFSAFASLQQQKCHPSKQNNGCRKINNDASNLSPKRQLQLRSIRDPDFWTCKSTWRRARINTLRCLVGCTIGDFSALWILQTFYPTLGMGVIMGASSNSTTLSSSPSAVIQGD